MGCKQATPLGAGSCFDAGEKGTFYFLIILTSQIAHVLDKVECPLFFLNATGDSTGTGNEMSSDGTDNYTYDADGNLITKTVIATGVETTYTWDYRNRLTEVQQVSGGVTTTLAQYTYDALNNPIEVVEGGSTRYTLYDGQTPLLDFNGSGTVTARYLSVPGAIDEVLARQTSAGVAWYLTDREGSVNDIINNSGTVIDHVDYGAYGTMLDESSPSNGDRFKYAGMELDTVTGLYYDRARYYDAALGRFVGEDTSEFSSGDTNFYRYAGNSPVDNSDGTGNADDPVILVPRPIPSPIPTLTPTHGGTSGAPLNTLIPPSGNMLRNPSNFPEVTEDANTLENLSRGDKLERGVGCYMNDQGDFFIGMVKNGKLIKNNTGGKGGGGQAFQIELETLYSPPSGWFLVGVIHTHPPNANPASKNPQNSPLDPVNCNLSFGSSPAVPWLVIDSDNKIWLIGPDIRGGKPNSTAR